MFETLKSVFKVKEMRRKLLYLIWMIFVIRIGSQLPVPGVDSDFFKQWFESNTGDAFNFFDAFTGGSFERMSIFALNITPYITSSIIMQLLTIAIPKLEEMQRDGEDGRKKMVAITRYVTVALALIQSTAMAIGFGRQGYLIEFNALNVITTITALTAGSALLMWVGERITEKGIGNGISIVLVINIISRMPEDMGTLWSQFIANKSIPKGIVAGLIIIAIIVAMVVFVVVLQDAERRIPVQYSKKLQGRKQVGGQSTHIPLKVNTAGVMPIIFASSLMQFPVILVQLFSTKQHEWTRYLSSSYWCRTSDWKYSIGLLVYLILIVVFAYFYTSITFNPLEIANNLRRQSGVIPGINPGKPTSDYLNRVLNYIVLIGAVFLMVVALVPILCSGLFNASVSFGGTSIIIIVGVVLETAKQIESMMAKRYYKGFLSD